MAYYAINCVFNSWATINPVAPIKLNISLTNNADIVSAFKPNIFCMVKFFTLRSLRSLRPIGSRNSDYLDIF